MYLVWHTNSINQAVNKKRALVHPESSWRQVGDYFHHAQNYSSTGQEGKPLFTEWKVYVCTHAHACASMRRKKKSMEPLVVTCYCSV